ncbi:MAG: glycosyltransferase family 4 protein [Anaerolineae bacterium]|nr:glycosyltransferase family 4 protein [Anaerolineae bacterium]
MPINRVIHLSKMTGAAGSEGHLLVLLHGLRARGLDARLWILVEPGSPVQGYVDRAEALGIPTERLPIARHIAPGLWRTLAARFRQAQPDAVHTHLLHADLYGIPAARRAKVPVVISSRHNDDKFRRWPPIRLLHRWLWRQTNAGIAISEAIRRFCIDVEGVPADRIHTIYYGLNPASIKAPTGARTELCETLNIPTDALIVGSVCRLIEQKGLVYGLRGFVQIAGQVPEAHYVIAGDGDLRAALKAEARALGLGGRVHFLGWRSDAHAVLAALDVLLAPSLWEGFGLVFLEAMALHVPVISTCVSAIPEVVIDGETGWLVPPGDANAIAAALLDALTHPDVMRARGANGRRRLETHFSPDTMIDRTLALYRSLEVGG